MNRYGFEGTGRILLISFLVCLVLNGATATWVFFVCESSSKQRMRDHEHRGVHEGAMTHEDMKEIRDDLRALMRAIGAEARYQHEEP
jgi:hypothetical protein